MAKALFFSFPLSGHIYPSLPLVRELIQRGDEIIYYATDEFAAKVAGAHARYCSYRNPFLDDLRHLPEQLHELSWLLMRTTAEVLDRELEAFRAERPDYLLTDSLAPWGQWVAALLGIPVVTSICTFAVNRHVFAFALAHGARPKSLRLVLSKIRHSSRALLLQRQLRRRYGVLGPGLMRSVFGHSDLNIVYTSHSFQPCADSFDHHFYFVGPSIAPRTESRDFPWEQVRHPIVVYASLGTLFNTDVAFYRNCFAAWGGQDLQVILAIGTHLPQESLGVIPPNFLVQAYVPQLDILPRVAVFVTHGGMNSVNESLYYGVPVVVIPQMSEQELVGRRVEELGAGLYLAKEEATAEKLRECVQRLLTESRFRQQAAQVGESLRAAGGVTRAADAILAFTR